MKIYIASRFKNKRLIREIMPQWTQDHEIVSTWHDMDDAADAGPVAAVERDLAELDACDAVLVLTYGCEQTPGGLHFEAGYAHAQGKPIYVHGPRVNVFLVALGRDVEGLEGEV